MMLLLLRACVSVTLLVGGFLLLERFTLYAFDPRRVPPAEAGLPELEERVFETPNGREMIYWTGTPEASAPVLLYLHGNASNLANRHRRLRAFLDRGYAILAPSYPGSSGTGGWPSQSAITDDIAAFYRAATQGTLTGTPLIPAIYGESIGAAVAIQMIGDDTLRNGAPPPRAIILEAPFTSIRDVARDLNPWLQVPAVFLTNPWDSLDLAPKLESPLLILHGTDDTLIPIAQGRELFDAAASPDKHFHPAQDAGHVSVWTVTTQRVLFRWLAERTR